MGLSLGGLLKKGASVLTGGGSDLLLTALTAGGALLGNKGKTKAATEQYNVDAANRVAAAKYANDTNRANVADQRASAAHTQANLNARRSMAQGLMASLNPDITGINSGQMESILAGSRSAPTTAAPISDMATVTPNAMANPNTGNTYDMLSSLLNTTATGMAQSKAAKKAKEANPAFDMEELLNRLRGGIKKPAAPPALDKGYA